MTIFLNIAENPDEKFDIKFQISPNTTTDELSDVEGELYKEIEQTCNIIKSLKHSKEEIKRKYFDKLLSLSRAGFLSASPSPKTALMSLEVLKKEMLLVEGRRIKNSYMLYLGIGALCSIVICWGVYFILAYYFDVSLGAKYFFVWSGAMIGVWISFGARKFVIQFEDLSVLEEDNMYIYIRLPYIGLCALVFLLIVNSGIFGFKIGDISTENLSSNIEMQILFGVVAGLLESKLGVEIYKKAVDMTSKL